MTEQQMISDSSVFSRVAIESAMDAYDRYREFREHAEIFGAFGEPRDFWVRSTRPRKLRVYPTKPIVGFLSKRTAINGGWGQKHDAAARLHNSGYIIVSQTDEPVTPAADKQHLLRDADRFRLLALNYYIEPARERHASEVSIRASDIAQVTGGFDKFPNICSSLGGSKFQELAKVQSTSFTTPNPSSTTVFTYVLLPKPEPQAMANHELSTLSATNLILYGPPGTGKTYHSAWEAVRLCIGNVAAEELRGEERRAALMARYRELVRDDRIEFVTFHQSMTYEEFVEGLRPETGGDSEEGVEQELVGPGFRLEPVDGVFKRISERARLDRGEGMPSTRLDRSKRVFKISLGRRGEENERIKLGLDQGIIHLGWGGDMDWADDRFEDFYAIQAQWRARKDPNATGHDPDVRAIYSFRSDLEVGDYVVVSDGRDLIQAFGKVVGAYYYDRDATFHPHRRKVQWIWRDSKGAERGLFYPNMFRQSAVYKLNQSRIDWDALEAIVCKETEPRSTPQPRGYVLVIDEINRANISKVLGELITLLEPDKRLGLRDEITVTLPYSKSSFGVPPNLHIIGTMNSADRSIALLDTALRRRFTFRELMPDPSVLSANCGGINLQAFLATINGRIEYLFDREHQIGHAYFVGCKTRADVEDVVRSKVIPLLVEYFFDDWRKVAAVLGDAPQGKPRFLESRALKAPDGFDEAEDATERLSWSIKGLFDFSEFLA